MFKKLHQEGAPLPKNKEEAVAYAEELADGIGVWAKIDVIAVAIATVLYITGIINATLLGLAVFFALGCPIVMTFGFSFGCLQCLTPGECYLIIKTRLSA